MNLRRAIAVALMALLPAGLVWTAWSKRQPVVDSSTLSEWVVIYAGKNPRLASSADKARACNAIARIGTNAIPHLLAWLDYRPSYLRQTAFRAYQHLPGWAIQNNLVKKLLLHSEARDWAQSAPQAFAALGSSAAPALPELLRRIESPNSPPQHNNAILALSYMGPLALPAMGRLAQHPDYTENVLAMRCLANLGTNALPLLPVLLKNLENTNSFVVCVMLSALADLQLEPERVLPALLQALHDPRYDVRCKVPYALMAYGDIARFTLPALTNALSDTNRFVRQSAAMAIQNICQAASLTAESH